MTANQTLFTSTLALALMTAAHADLEYQSVSLTAEAFCEYSQDLKSESSLDAAGDSEVSASCGATDVSAYFNQGKGRFSMAAGSTTANAKPLEGNGFTDNGMGHAAVEITIAIDQVTHFRMPRCLEGSKVQVWEGKNMIHTFQRPDDEGGLLPGTYQFTMENSSFEEPAWAEISFEQASGISGDMDNNGTLDQRDLVKMLDAISNGPSVAGNGKEKTRRGNSIEAGKQRRARCGTKPTASKNSKQDDPGFAASKPRGKWNKPGSGASVAHANSKKPNLSDCTPMDKLPPNFAGNDRTNSINAASSGKEPRKPSPDAISIERIQGDMDGDGQVSMQDLAELLSRL